MAAQMRDENHHPVPVFRRRAGLAHNVEVAAGNASLIEFDSKTTIVSFWAEGTVYLKFGDENIIATADDHALPAGVVDYEPLIDQALKKVATHVSVYSEDGVNFYLSERE